MEGGRGGGLGVVLGLEFSRGVPDAAGGPADGRERQPPAARLAALSVSMLQQCCSFPPFPPFRNLIELI